MSDYPHRDVVLALVATAPPLPPDRLQRLAELLRVDADLAAADAKITTTRGKVRRARRAS